jgi:hypothetical protein
MHMLNSGAVYSIGLLSGYHLAFIVGAVCAFVASLMALRLVEVPRTHTHAH